MKIRLRYWKLSNYLPSMLIAALTMGVLSLSTGVQAATLLERLEGKWKGVGTAVNNPRSAAVRVRCKSTNRFSGNNRVLTLSGVCASAQGRRTMEARFETGRDGRTIRHVSLTTEARVSEAAVTAIDDKSIRLELQVAAPSGGIERLRTVITVAGSRYFLVTSRHEGDKWKEQSRIIFQK